MQWTGILLLTAMLQNATTPVAPVRTEVVAPIRNATFDKLGKAKKRVQGGNPRTVGSILLFDGSTDGNRQVDPQIAVGGGYVLHGTNSGLVIYDNKGNYVNGVPQSEFNNGIDPKLFFDAHNRIFAFDLWTYWDEAKLKPVNVSVSETSNPLGAWNTYPISAAKGVDGGGIGYSRKWIGYSFPGGDERTFVLKTAEAKSGKPTTVYHFKGSLGHPVNVQDKTDDLYFVNLTDSNIQITRVFDKGDGTPQAQLVADKPHGFKNFGWPPQSPMKGTDKKTASGDRNPKGLVVQNRHLWFSQAVNVDGRAAVQWHKFKLDGTPVYSEVISHPVNSYIQTTLGVNKRGEVLVGFQETGPEMHISGRCAYRFPDRDRYRGGILKLAEGVAPTEGGAWGDYSGTVVDGDDQTTLWTIQTYANAKGRGSTVIARVPFDDQLRRQTK